MSAKKGRISPSTPTRHGSVGSGILQFMNLGHEVKELGPSSSSKKGRRLAMIEAIKRVLHDPHSKLRWVLLACRDYYIYLFICMMSL